jgi:hypothetical protein
MKYITLKEFKKLPYGTLITYKHLKHFILLLHNPTRSKGLRIASWLSTRSFLKETSLFKFVPNTVKVIGHIDDKYNRLYFELFYGVDICPQRN